MYASVNISGNFNASADATAPVQRASYSKSSSPLQDNRPKSIGKKNQIEDLRNHNVRQLISKNLQEKSKSLNVTDPNPIQAKSNQPVVQRWLDPALLSNKGGDKRIKDLLHKALNYNSHRKGKTRTMRLNELNILQVSIMKWLDEYSVPDQNVSQNALWVKELMNDVQAEHQNLVKTSIQNNDDLPPVANFNTLKAEEQKQVTTIWHQLVKGTGNVHITEEENYTNTETKLAGSRIHEGFRFEVLAQFARLLETETGRNIVSHVNKDTKGEKPVTIKPGFAHPSQGAPAAVFAAGPTISNNSEKLTPLPVPLNQMFKGQKDANKKRENYKKQFIELDLKEIADNKLKATAIYNARKNNPKAKGLKIGDKYFLFGSGIGVNVTITRDIRDAEDHHTSRSVDENRNEIPAPNFITLGHELGHATHMLDGVSLNNSKVSDHLFPQVGVHGAEELKWSNMEEYGNIHSVENSIRKEYGMKERFGHINQSTVQWELLNKIINAFLPLCDLQPEDDRTAVNDLLGQAGNLSNEMKIPEARVAIKGAATSFTTHIHTVFPQFLASERGAIKTQLDDFKTHVNSAHADVLAKAEANIAQSIILINQANARIQAIPQPAPQQQGGFFSRLWPF
ncbi:hypothetical protein [Flavobacterium pectinovorum]|uniref:Uncharacterized protein n=1 Tax=Flavobacterium pectinovorum TaxID=29533 RepID=A0A502ETG0_9FLAO|nr:hypothetical protein [Flavobacterium pectinovorum]TPG40837.1 hypothetical protein EAH81_10870 [Flavobacterium pectinovorum]